MAAACGGGPKGSISVENPRLSVERAQALAQSAIEGFSDCDHDAWTAAWDESLKAQSTADEFLPYCTGYVRAHGAFERIEAVTHVAAETAGYVRWDVTARFGTGPVIFSFVIAAEGERIEGYIIDPPL